MRSVFTQSIRVRLLTIDWPYYCTARWAVPGLQVQCRSLLERSVRLPPIRFATHSLIRDQTPQVKHNRQYYTPVVVVRINASYPTIRHPAIRNSPLRDIEGRPL